HHHHRICSARHCLEHFVHVAFGAGVRVFVGQVDRSARMTPALQLGAELVPAPCAVIRTVHEHEVHISRIRCEASRKTLPASIAYFESLTDKTSVRLAKLPELVITRSEEHTSELQSR